MEEACLMGFSGGFEQGKLVSALLQLNKYITIKPTSVNLKPIGIFFLEVFKTNYGNN